MAGMEASLMEQGLDWISKELVGDNSSSAEDPMPRV